MTVRKCICENMTKVGTDMHNPIYKSLDYKGFTMHENYGRWDLQFSDDVRQSVEIFYCPFCGRRLNDWSWERRDKNFEKYIKGYKHE